jgi:hypothetical protein
MIWGALVIARSVTAPAGDLYNATRSGNSRSLATV